MNKWRNTVIGLISAFLVFIIIFCAVPIKTVDYQVTVQRQVPETYYVTEPYQVQEAYTDQEPYSVRESYTVWETRKLKYQVTGASISVGSISVALRNTDILAGRFKVKFCIAPGPPPPPGYASVCHVLYDTIYLMPGESGVASAEHNHLSWHDWRYEVLPPTDNFPETKYRNVTKYRSVTKYRTVTKYRQVEKERMVTKTFSETRYRKVSMLEYLTRY